MVKEAVREDGIMKGNWNGRRCEGMCLLHAAEVMNPVISVALILHNAAEMLK